MNVEEALAVIDDMRARYPGRITARLIPPGRNTVTYHVELSLPIANRRFKLEYPGQLEKALEGWQVFLLTEKEQARMIAAATRLPVAPVGEEDEPDVGGDPGGQLPHLTMLVRIGV